MAKLGRVRGRILIVHGTADTLIPPSHAKALSKGSPGATLVLVEDAGHELAYRPEAQVAILRWLSSNDAPAPLARH